MGTHNLWGNSMKERTIPPGPTGTVAVDQPPWRMGGPEFDSSGSELQAGLKEIPLTPGAARGSEIFSTGNTPGRVLGTSHAWCHQIVSCNGCQWIVFEDRRIANTSSPEECNLVSSGVKYFKI